MGVILGVLDSKLCEQEFNISNEKSKHLIDRKNRLNLRVEQASPLFYYDVLKDNGRQIHCLYEDATLLVYNKNTKRLITAILLGRSELEKYIKKTNVSLHELTPTLKCSQLHDKLRANDNSVNPKSIIKKKYKYIGGNDNG